MEITHAVTFSNEMRGAKDRAILFTPGQIFHVFQVFLKYTLSLICKREAYLNSSSPVTLRAYCNIFFLNTVHGKDGE